MENDSCENKVDAKTGAEDEGALEKSAGKKDHSA